jgi:hypothetical protein
MFKNKIIMSGNKMDASTVYTLFEEIKETLERNNENKRTKSVQPDMTEQFNGLIEEIRKPVRTEHRHIIEIGSSKVFILLIVMGLVILILSYVVGEQRRCIGQYRDNDLKYRYVKMKGGVDEKGLFQLEQRFLEKDSVEIVRKEVEKYEKQYHEYDE